jgi:hypothetical protein
LNQKKLFKLPLMAATTHPKTPQGPYFWLNIGHAMADIHVPHTYFYLESPPFLLK